jgi:long-chain acyl-CoA synthetase
MLRLNQLLYPVALAAIARAGFIGVTMNPIYTAREVEYQLGDSGAAALVVAEPFAGLVAEVIARTQVRHVIMVPMQDVRQVLFAAGGDRLTGAPGPGVQHLLVLLCHKLYTTIFLI